MRLILQGNLKPTHCTCMYVQTNPENPDENTGISVARSCPTHGHMLEGYMWHPALGCECIVVRHKRTGKVTFDKSKCPRHREPEPELALPIAKTVMK